MINYFGTNLIEHGHYMWEIDDQGFKNRNLYTRMFGFDVEEIGKPERGELVIKGQVRVFQVRDYTVLKIEGSCVDNRGGTRSVFIIKGNHTLSDMKEHICCNITAKKIIDQIPFKILW